MDHGHLQQKKKPTSASLMEALEEKSKSCRVSRYFVPGNMNFCAKFQVASVANKIKIKIYTRNQNCKGGIELKNILSFKSKIINSTMITDISSFVGLNRSLLFWEIYLFEFDEKINTTVMFVGLLRC